MEVLSVYMDLQEGKKKGNVWKLESEAFKKPIEIKIWYENKELAEFQKETLWLRNQLENHDKQMAQFLETQNQNNKAFEAISNKFRETANAINTLTDELDAEKKENSELYKKIADQQTVIETHSGTILKLQEQVKLLEKKITKQPMVFHDKWFISWRESSGLWMINIPDGDYLMIMNTKVWEHNEYVTNCDQLIMDKIKVEGQHYVPFYKLEWGTELDTPTATIYYDLVFIPM